MSLFKGLFKKSASAKIISAFDKIANDCKYSACTEIKSEFVQYVKDTPDLADEKLKPGEKSPESLALLLMNNLTRSYLCSGQYHVYRGVLSLEGEALYDLWKYTAQKLYDLQLFNDESIKEARQQVAEDIKLVG